MADDTEHAHLSDAHLRIRRPSQQLDTFLYPHIN